jgi:hypothetical protein
MMAVNKSTKTSQCQPLDILATSTPTKTAVVTVSTTNPDSKFHLSQKVQPLAVCLEMPCARA